MRILFKDVYVKPQKIKDYLLNINHPDGGSKAKLLIGLGFDLNGANLENAIVNHATNNEVTKMIATPFGEKYIVEGILETPSDKSIQVRSI